MPVHEKQKDLKNVKLNTKVIENDKPINSQMLFDFLFFRFQLIQTESDEALIDSLLKLDNLAKKVDSLIDLKGQKITSLSTSKWINLEVEKCLENLEKVEVEDLEALKAETQDMVEKSLRYNQKQRASIYSLNSTTAICSSTLDYLYPLFNRLFQRFLDSEANSRKVFLELASLIQLLDDLVDLKSDLESGIDTPLTSLWKMSVKSETLREVSFVSNVEFFIKERLVAVQEILSLIHPQISDQLINSWSFSLTSMFSDEKISTDREFLDKINSLKNKIPQILSYF